MSARSLPGNVMVQAMAELALHGTGRSRADRVIERRMWGTCVNEGCTPTKTMVAGTGRISRARGADYGFTPGTFAST